MPQVVFFLVIWKLNMSFCSAALIPCLQLLLVAAALPQTLQHPERRRLQAGQPTTQLENDIETGLP